MASARVRGARRGGARRLSEASFPKVLRSSNRKVRTTGAGSWSTAGGARISRENEYRRNVKEKRFKTKPVHGDRQVDVWGFLTVGG